MPRSRRDGYDRGAGVDRSALRSTR